MKRGKFIGEMFAVASFMAYMFMPMATYAQSTSSGNTVSYVVNPEAKRQVNEGWGVSLCWWANMCGKWSDAKIDQLVEWLVSPKYLNYNIFRYNIGGGDDPENRNCTPHHMGAEGGKGLRAEMEGFKDSSDGEYIWSRDEAQRKIMLKIKEKRPDAIFEAFSNSAPYYMTYSGCCAGHTNASRDNLKPEYYEEFAHYLVDVCKHYKDVYGIEFKTLEPFNEPNTNYWGANGGQEGCHFDFKSQIEFLKVLAPILKESGLNTVIAASDETNVSTSVNGFKEYQKAGVLDLVGQWNVHTYSASNNARSQIGTLARNAGKTIWMSETGSGGNGIEGNLQLAQRLIDDIKYIMPSAWIDWQYVEEWNDQWCLVKGNFAQQTYERVKNFYVREQITRFIKQGYTYVATMDPNTLAAVNETSDTLVLVAINTTKETVKHEANLLFCDSIGRISGKRTSQTENLAGVWKYEVNGTSIGFSMPKLSIATFVIPFVASKAKGESLPINTDATYMIMPQYNTATALQANNGNVMIQDISLDSSEPEMNENVFTRISPSQKWHFVGEGNTYSLVNDNDEIITATQSYALSTSSVESDGQQFLITPIDGNIVKITTPDGIKAFDLESEKYTSGTKVGLWEYGNSVSAGHRNWVLMRIPDKNTIINNVGSLTADSRPCYSINVKGDCVMINNESKEDSNSANLLIYSSSGSMMQSFPLQKGETVIPMSKGIYIMCINDGNDTYSKTVMMQ